MGYIEEVGARLMDARASLPQDMVVIAAEGLQAAELQYQQMLHGTNTAFHDKIYGGIRRAEQALSEASEALQGVSAATIGYLAVLGVDTDSSTSHPSAEPHQISSIPRQETSLASESLPAFTALNGGPHVVARTEINTKLRSIAKADLGMDEVYRIPVPDDQVSWDVEVPDYNPPFIDIPRGQSSARKPDDHPDPTDPNAIGSFTTLSGETITREADGRPRNPVGRTGMAGRGMLNMWGENPAADLIVTRENPETGELEVAAIQRQDTGEWALPGGKVDEGESAATTALREFYEEAGGRDYGAEAAEAVDDPWDLDMSKAKTVYAGYIDDSRNTDNAWMASTVFHRHLSPEEAGRITLQASTDAQAVKWAPVTSRFFASHGQLVHQAVQKHREQ